MTALGLRVLMVTALIGSGVSVVAVAMGAAGIVLIPTWLAALLIPCGAISVIGYSALSISMQRRLGYKDQRRILSEGAPRWLRGVTMFITLVGFGLWVWSMSRRGGAHQEGFTPLMAGAFGLFLFPSGLSSAYSYSRKRAALNRRCPAGHEVPFDASFCPICGSAVEPVA